jgi:pimeloyl-ACP methyl ester carboxylesterase
MELSCETHGQGQPVLCLHGFGMDRAVMATVTEPVLSQRPGLARIYLDLPGHGASPGGPPDSDAVAAAVHQFMTGRLAGPPVVLAGWSYGGYIAAAIAARWPGSVAGLLLICSGVKIRPADRTLPPGPRPPAEPGWLDGVPEGLRGHLDTALGHRTAAVAGAVAAALTAVRLSDEPYLERLREHGYPLADEAGLGYPGPACVLAGRQDGIGGYADQFAALERYPAASYAVLDRAGHYLPFEQPAAFAAVTLAWLDQAKPGFPAAGDMAR